VLGDPGPLGQAPDYPGGRLAVEPVAGRGEQERPRAPLRALSSGQALTAKRFQDLGPPPSSRSPRSLNSIPRADRQGLAGPGAQQLARTNGVLTQECRHGSGWRRQGRREDPAPIMLADRRAHAARAEGQMQAVTCTR
jgi:hypothetical protein